MTPRAIVVGSLNLDEFFSVPHIVAEGETLSSSGYQVQPGGKGANQSVALAQAGARVSHCGCIAHQDDWLRTNLGDYGVDVEGVLLCISESSGRAIIQSSTTSKDNAIVLFPGVNHSLNYDEVLETVQSGRKGDWLVLQNEVRFIESPNNSPQRTFKDLARSAKKLQMFVAFNPAPYTEDVPDLFSIDENLDVLILNRQELCAMIGEVSGEQTCFTMLNLLADRLVNVPLIIVTLGAEGLLATLRPTRDNQAVRSKMMIQLEASSLVNPLVDTTGAGDTFIGFLIAGLMRSRDSDPFTADDVMSSLREATVAASLCCEKEGAMASIPTITNVEIRIELLKELRASNAAQVISDPPRKNGQ